VLHLIPLPITKPLADNYLPAQFNHTDYPQLVAEGAPVDTIAVGSVMATFAWPPGHERYKKVARFVEAFFGKFQLFMHLRGIRNGRMSILRPRCRAGRVLLPRRSG
jgi:hypothetical protein